MNNRLRDGCFIGGLALWAGAAFTTWRLPGAKWLGTHAPPWLAWASMGAAGASLVCFRVFSYLEARNIEVPLWGAGFVVATWFSQSLLISIWVTYTLPEGTRSWFGLFGLVVLLFYGALSLFKRNRRAAQRVIQARNSGGHPEDTRVNSREP